MARWRTTSADDFDEVLNMNLRGAFLCVRAAIKLMVKQRSGHILLIGSRAGKQGTRGQAAYAAAKAGLVGLGQSIAKEYGARNIRCNIVLPGFLETKFVGASAGETAGRNSRRACAGALQHGGKFRARPSRFSRGWTMFPARSSRSIRGWTGCCSASGLTISAIT